MKTSYLFLVLFLVASPAFAQTLESPSNLNATPISRTQLLVSWEDNSDNEDGFLIFDEDEYLGAVPANTESVRIPELTPGETVQFTIYAYIGQLEQGIIEQNSLPASTPPVIMADGTVTRYGHQATVGEPFSAVLYTDDFSLQSSASITGLPDWATFTELTGTISGTPDAEGVHSLSLVVNYSNGFTLTETVPLRVLPANSGPILANTLPSPEYHPDIEPQSIDLNAYFTDPDCSRAVRMTFSNLGDVDIILYENATPNTVSNFLKYVSENSSTGETLYDRSFIHRSIPGFVIQGGGFRPSGGNNFVSVPVLGTVDNELGTVDNEPGIENVRGTISMAKQGGNPDSATNQWFISLADNRANLDLQNGGFTAFGRVAGNGMNVVDAIAALPTGKYSDITITVDEDPRSGSFSDCPMNVNTETAPASMEQDKLVLIDTAVEIDPLAYEIVSNSDSSVADATVSEGTLQITPLKPGNCTLKIRATDLDGNQIEEDITITVVSWTFDGWSTVQGLDAEQGGILDDADGDSLPNFIEYALFGDSATSTPALAKPQKVRAGTTDVEDYLAIEFSTRNGIEDALVCVEVADQLTDTIWTEIWNSSQGSSAAQVHSTDVATDHIDWVIRDTQPNSTKASRFMRVRVEHVDSQ